MIVACDSSDCSFYRDGECSREYINIEQDLTASGFHPICQDYQEKEEPNGTIN